jgi:RNA-directed DNA polymerase
MLNEFDQYLDKLYLSKKARKDRWYWNHSIKIGRKPAIEENRQWKPSISYCRFADDFIFIVKGTKADAEFVRNQCRSFLEEELKLTLNMDKSKITHINDGFTFLGHRIIRKRGSNGNMNMVTGIPKGKARAFSYALSKELSGDLNRSMIDKVEKLNQKLQGWAQFYRYTEFTARVYSKIDQVVFWKFAKWLSRKYKCRIKPLLIKWYKKPAPGLSKTWVLFGKTDRGNLCGISLLRLVGSIKQPFKWRLPESNPYLRAEVRNTITSNYEDVAMAISHN